MTALALWRAPALAHGSRDPRSAATVAALAELTARRNPELDVAVSFLDLSAPRALAWCVVVILEREGHGVRR